MKTRKLANVAVAVVVSMAVLLAACGSSSKSGGAGSGGDGGGGGTPVKLGVMTGINSDTLSTPWVRQGARIAAAAVNAKGGVMGHPVEIDFCDDHSTPQGAATCAQKLLVQDKVLMMVGDDGVQEPALIPTLPVAKTISWGSGGGSLDSLKDERVYVLDPVQASFWVLPQMLPASTEHVAYLSADTAVAQAVEKDAAKYYPKRIKITPITIPLDATNMEPTCLQIKRSGADTIVFAANITQPSALLRSCHQMGLSDVLFATPTVEVSPELVRTVTELHQPNLIALAFGGDTLAQFAANAAKYGPKIGGITNTVGDYAVNSWLAVKLLAERVIPKVGSLDASKVKAWLDRQTAFDTGGATAPIDFTATPYGPLPRLKNLSASKGEIKDGKLIAVGAKPFVAHTT